MEACALDRAGSMSAIPTRPRLISVLGVDLACHDEATMTTNTSVRAPSAQQAGGSRIDAAKVGSALQRA
jgi:hypothetical protein